MRKFGVVLLLVIVAAGIAYVLAGRQPGPQIEITHPAKFVGATTPVDATITTPGGKLVSVSLEFEEKGTRTALGTFDPAHLTVEAPDKIHLTAQISKDSVPSLATGAAKIVVKATRPVLWGLRQATTEAAREVQVRLERPRIDILSTHHYINLGGSEMVAYRVSPADVESGVAVGQYEYPGYPASGANGNGVNVTDPAVRIAFFALLFDQDVNADIHVYARDEAGNSATAPFDHKTFPKVFKSSRIPLDDRFIDRVVPAILGGTTEVKAAGSTIDSFVVINSELRKKNAETIRALAKQTAPQMLWGGVPFRQFVNHAVESAFADRRTYIYNGKEVDHQVHLGFDLASFAHAPVVAANRGRVLYAKDLGIYGNCVIIDHGMGVQSLYAHLSQIDVKPGDEVAKEQPIGRSGMTGLAAGDHLHFTMLVNGQMVTPIEWWDPHWVEDRVMRKLHELH